MKITFFTLDDYEQKVILDKAKELNIDPDGLVELYQSVMESNFEQDIHDIALENEEYLIKDYGLDKDTK